MAERAPDSLPGGEPCTGRGQGTGGVRGGITPSVVGDRSPEGVAESKSCRHRVGDGDVWGLGFGDEGLGVSWGWVSFVLFF